MGPAFSFSVNNEILKNDAERLKLLSSKVLEQQIVDWFKIAPTTANVRVSGRVFAEGRR